MSDLYNQIVNDRGSLERLMARLPGFSGYIDRGTRRDADRILRDTLAENVDRQIKRLAQIERRLLDNGGLKYMTRTQDAKNKLQMYHDRLKGAAPGYSGFFEAVKIDAEELDFLYGFDELQMVSIDRLTAALDTLSKAAEGNGDIDAAISELDTLARSVNDAYLQRHEKLLNLQISNPSDT
jgi:hypothetical protein